MYSILVSKIVKGMQLVNEDVKKIINKNDNIVILPWAFPNELNSEELKNNYFKQGGEKYNKYVDAIKNLGLKEEKVFIGDCYNDDSEFLKNKIREANILVLPGGNPEMFFSKVVQEKELLYEIKKFKGLIIGESAGCCLHFKRYFITAKNNYYKYFAFYDGFGIVNDSFYVDVHSTRNGKYLNKLKKLAKEKNKKVYAIFDDGAILLDRVSNKIKIYGQVIIIEPDKDNSI